MNEELDLTYGEQSQLDEIILKYMDAKDAKSKKRLVLECYKLLKVTGFNPNWINCLRSNDVGELADEMERFFQLHESVPHEHEKRKAA